MKEAKKPIIYSYISPHSNGYLEGGKNVIISSEIPLNKKSWEVLEWDLWDP
jgi:hypothetical protein